VHPPAYSFEEDSDVSDLLRKRPALFVIGQSNVARARLVNSILSDEILPVGPKRDAKWRPVKISHGIHRTLSFTLPDNSYQVVSPLLPQPYDGHKAKTVPEENLEEPCDDNDGSAAAGLAVCDNRRSGEDAWRHSALEVTVNSAALLKDLTVFVLPRTERDMFAYFAAADCLPIVAYAAEGQCLGEQVRGEGSDLHMKHKARASRRVRHGFIAVRLPPPTAGVTSRVATDLVTLLRVCCFGYARSRV